jgi:hypothetical protein
VAAVDFPHPYIILNIQGWVGESLVSFFVRWVEGASPTIISMMDAVKLPHLNTFWLNPPPGYNRVDGGLADCWYHKIIS